MFETLGEKTSWPARPLGDFLTIRKDLWVDIDDTSTYEIIGVTSRGGGIAVRRSVMGVELTMRRYQTVLSDQLMWCKVDTKNGAFGVTKTVHTGALASMNMCLADINLDLCLPTFLQFFFRIPVVANDITTASLGTTNRQYLKPQELLDQVRLHLPTLSEQRRIVARIEELAAKIEEARGLRREAVAESDLLVSSLHLKLAATRTITIRDFLALDEEREEVRSGRLYPQVGVKGFGQGLFPRETLDASQTTYKSFNTLYDGAVVLSQVKGWEGAIAVCPSNLVGRFVSPEYRTFRCINGEAVPEYLAKLVATPWFWTQLKDLTRGVGARRERTRPEQFLQMKLPMPEVEQQKRAIAIFERLDSLKPLQTETADELDALLPSVLDKAFRGEL